MSSRRRTTPGNISIHEILSKKRKNSRNNQQKFNMPKLNLNSHLFKTNPSLNHNPHSKRLRREIQTMRNRSTSNSNLNKLYKQKTNALFSNLLASSRGNKTSRSGEHISSFEHLRKELIKEAITKRTMHKTGLSKIKSSRDRSKGTLQHLKSTYKSMRIKSRKPKNEKAKKAEKSISPTVRRKSMKRGKMGNLNSVEKEAASKERSSNASSMNRFES